MTSHYESWGRYFHYEHEVKTLAWRSSDIDFSALKTPLLPYGLGRSYGDSCLNEGGTLLDVSGMRRFISFDKQNGRLRCEAGTSLRDILQLIVPRGWFLPVSPGTQFVTLGGAIANDLHGKNHHRAGTLGRYVTQFELMRSDGTIALCSPQENTELFRATIGGLGLTGLIRWAEIQLKPIQSAAIDQESIRFTHLDEFFELSADSDQDYEYTVAWIDPLVRADKIGRGLFMRGNHAASNLAVHKAHGPRHRLSLPCECPNFLINQWTIQAFNTLYYHKQRHDKVSGLVHYEPFFYPLDAVSKWNRVYGRRGFFQYQCVVPYDGNAKPLQEILQRIAEARAGSFLTVLKMMGDLDSPGTLSFPKKGVTLAIDFPNEGAKTLHLMDRLDEIVVAHQGSLYPAKDARMSPQTFQSLFPQWESFIAHQDPQFSSSFWRRVLPQVQGA